MFMTKTSWSKTKTKTKTFIFVLEAPWDQDAGLEDYITGLWLLAHCSFKIIQVTNYSLINYRYIKLFPGSVVSLQVIGLDKTGLRTVIAFCKVSSEWDKLRFPGNCWHPAPEHLKALSHH